jgi:hypothetical protein
MSSIIHVGHTKEAIEEVGLVIMGILSAPHADEKTKIAAMAAVASSLRVPNASISDCAFTDINLDNKEEEK